jgi:hypothetical protein
LGMRSWESFCNVPVPCRNDTVPRVVSTHRSLREHFLISISIITTITYNETHNWHVWCTTVRWMRLGAEQRTSAEDGVHPGGGGVMERERDRERGQGRRIKGRDQVPGIVIAHGGWQSSAKSIGSGLRAFVYGEKVPASPTLPFGRWKGAS